MRYAPGQRQDIHIKWHKHTELNAEHQDILGLIGVQSSDSLAKT